MAQGLSEQSHEQWEAFALGVGSDVSHPLDRELLNQFLIGVHQRGEELSAHDLKTLVEELDVGAELALEIVSFVEPALALLEAYDRSLTATAPSDEDRDYSEGALLGDDDVAPGILVL
ncbi:MAG: hypothetical protein M3N28_10950 [Actinomycetota bacterium]|nr:hypothetical protein [Actinomycetota bacterium]